MLISNISFPFCEKKEEKNKKSNSYINLLFHFSSIYIYLLEAQTPASILWGTC